MFLGQSYKCVCVCVCVCVCLFKYVCMYACTQVRFVCLCVYIHMYVYVCIHKGTYIYIYRCTCILHMAKQYEPWLAHTMVLALLELVFELAFPCGFTVGAIGSNLASGL